MPAYRLSRLVLVGTMTVLGSSSCSNPKNEAPVALTPGLYAVQIGAFGKEDSRMCFSGSDVDNVDKLIRKYYAFLEAGCSHKADQRVGNSISGAISCEIDSTAGYNTTYSGILTTDSLTVDATIVNYAPTIGASDKREEVTTESRLNARRVGSCG